MDGGFPLSPGHRWGALPDSCSAVGRGAGADASRMLSMLRQTLSRQVTRQNLKVERHTRPCPFLADSGQTSRQELTHAVDVLHHREGTFAHRPA